MNKKTTLFNLRSEMHPTNPEKIRVSGTLSFDEQDVREEILDVFEKKKIKISSDLGNEVDFYKDFWWNADKKMNKFIKSLLV